MEIDYVMDLLSSRLKGHVVSLDFDDRPDLLETFRQIAERIASKPRAKGRSAETVKVHVFRGLICEWALCSLLGLAYEPKVDRFEAGHDVLFFGKKIEVKSTAWSTALNHEDLHLNLDSTINVLGDPNDDVDLLVVGCVIDFDARKIKRRYRVFFPWWFDARFFKANAIKYERKKGAETFPFNFGVWYPYSLAATQEDMKEFSDPSRCGRNDPSLVEEFLRGESVRA